MGKLYKAGSVFLCCLALAVGCNKTNVNTADQGGNDDNYDRTPDVIYYAAPGVWVGPGFYYGVWFSTQFQFNSYNERHYHRHYHDRGDRRGDRHRDDGHRDRSRRGDSRRHDGGGHRGGANRPRGGGGGGGHHAPKHGK